MWLVHFTFYVLLSTCLSDNSSKLTLHIRSRYSIIACATGQLSKHTKCLAIHTVLHTHLKSTHTLTHSASEAVRVPLLIQSLPRLKNFPQHCAHVQIVASANNANEREILRSIVRCKCVPCVHAGTRTQSECTRGKCLCRYTQVVKYIIQFKVG